MAVDVQLAQSLAELGFSGLEAAIYVQLLRDGPSSGYRLSRALGKPVANIYNAIETLQGKGAVLSVDDGGTRICRAVQPAELFSGMQRAFAGRCSAAIQSLEALGQPHADERVYTIRTRAQVLARARDMLGSARKTAVIDVFPSLLAELRIDLEAAVRRGVAIAASLYESTDIAGVELIVHARNQLVQRIFPGGLLSLSIDASEYLIALFGREPANVRHALWTRNPWLAFLQHDSLICGNLTQALDQALAGTISLAQLREFRERMRPMGVLESPGMQRLLAEAGATRPATAEGSQAGL